ncbi:tetratricopeptide repeat protein [Anthocerotibacter panamensis]|uniref:tetratricopeptide repeat protein n=1 Tax=Anthocerotibacter panamensis TaxID=2857077 RepID=UPI001C40511C|nr:tetratricopeptide repeat protein [Anthocerotibacter panamensis]
MGITERQQLEATITALEGQRALLGDGVVETALGPLREKLERLNHQDQRKHVTVLFADVSGFTALAETMDPEDVRDLINRLWSRLDRLIIQRGGTVDKHMGDAVMALFGAPIAAEDDPERAIRVALDMQQEVERFNAELSLNGFSLQMRIGLNTGPVLLGEVGSTKEYTAIGDTVNVANRLEGAAPKGGILASHNTYRHVRGIFEVEALEPLDIRGKAEPVQAYLVKAIKPRAFRMGTRGVEGIETRMVGRERELTALQDALRFVFQERRMQLIPVVAEAGLGKSRLLHEFTNWLEPLPEQVYFFKGRAGPQMSKSPYALLRDLFSSRFTILDSDRAQVVRDKLTAGVQTFMGPGVEEKAHFIGQLLGFDFSQSPYIRGILSDPKQIRDRAFHYATQFFQASTRLPRMMGAVIFLDDLHWSDEGSLEFLKHLIEHSQGVPLLVVLLMRPVFFEDRPHWGAELAQTRLDLRPLEREASLQLVREILQKVPEIPMSLQDLVVHGAEGNPFYLEELIKMLIDDGVVVKGRDTWTIRQERLARLRVPPTLTGVLQARLEGLSTCQLTVLQRGSVLGRVFWDTAVEALNAGAPCEEIREALTDLRSKEFVFSREEISFVGTQEYAFKHALLHEVVYETILRKLRPSYHRQAAEWLIAQSGERVAEYAGVIGEHLELAGDKEAYSWYRLAGETAQAAYANNVAIDYYQRTLTLAPIEEQSAVMLKLGEVWQLTGKWAEAEQSYRQALDRAQVTGNRKVTAQCMRFIGELLRMKGASDDAWVWLEQALIEFKALGDTAGISRTMGNMGVVHWYHNEYDRALACYEEQIKIATKINDLKSIASAMGNVGIVYLQQGKYALALECCQQQLKIYNEIGDKLYLVNAKCNMGIIYYEQGDYSSALIYFQESLYTAHEIDHLVGITDAILNIGVLYHDHGDHLYAQKCYEKKLQLVYKIGDYTGNAMAIINLAEIYIILGRYQEGEVLFKHAIEIHRFLNMPYKLCYSLYNLADLCIHLHQYERAWSLNEEALQLAQQFGDKNVEFKAEISSIKLRRALDEIDEKIAAQELEKMLEQWQEKQYQADLHYALWSLDKTRHTNHDQGAQIYKELYGRTPKLYYSKRYQELTGVLLSDALSLPAISDIQNQDIMSIDEILKLSNSIISDLHELNKTKGEH